MLEQTTLKQSKQVKKFVWSGDDVIFKKKLSESDKFVWNFDDVVVESYPGHAGRPGLVGGAPPRSGEAGGVKVTSVTKVSSTPMYKGSRMKSSGKVNHIESGNTGEAIAQKIYGAVKL